MAVDRRESLRLKVRGRLEVRFAGSETRARVWDISDGGFALWTSELVLVGAPTMFSVGPPGGSPRLLCAKAVYVLPASGGGYFSGWAGEGDEAMELLRDTMTRLAEPMPA